MPECREVCRPRSLCPRRQLNDRRQEWRNADGRNDSCFFSQLADTTQSGFFASTLPLLPHPHPHQPGRLGPQRRSNPSSARTPRCRSVRSRNRPGSAAARSKARRACFSSGWNECRVWWTRWRGRSGIERAGGITRIARRESEQLDRRHHVLVGRDLIMHLYGPVG